MNAGDFSIIQKGKYKAGSFVYKGKLSKEEENILNDIKENKEILHKIIEHFFREPHDEAEFRFISKSNNFLIFRFFLQIRDPKIFAGYEIDFLIKKERVEKIYVSKVPLEK